MRERPRGRPLWRTLLKCFCASDSVSALFERSPTRNLAALDGLRSISMLWIILAHVQMEAISVGTDDQNAVTRTTESMPQQFTMGGTRPPPRACGRRPRPSRAAQARRSRSTSSSSSRAC